MDKLFNRISDADVRQFYNKTLCLYKGEPVYVREAAAGRISIVHLQTGKKEVVDFQPEDFGPLRSRIGMINESGAVFFMKRTPVRLMQVGHSLNNCRLETVILSNVEGGQRLATDRLRSLQTPSLYSAIKGEYPSFQTALKSITEDGRAGIAFDKQFAIDNRRNIFYRLQRVGVLPEGSKKIGDIQFKKGLEYLSLLLEQNYEKHSRDFPSK